MRLLKRNTIEFEHLAYKGKQEVLDDGRHTGRWNPQYADPVVCRGTIDLPSGYVSRELFGINVDYTHVLSMDKVNASIKEADLIVYGEDQYEILAVRKCLNFTFIAMKVLPEFKWQRPVPEPEPEPEPEPNTGTVDET